MAKENLKDTVIQGGLDRVLLYLNMKLSIIQKIF